jgi:uncharacterized protein YprB with RNaseH-like and TPR domain
MPDFAKALRGLRQPNTSWESQLALYSGAGGGLPAVSQRSAVPPGEVHSTALGSHYFIHAVYPGDHVHGKVRLGRFSSADLDGLMKVMHEKGTVPRRDRVVFLDTETTGIQGGAGMCPFLVGLGYFSGEDFHMVQFFIRDFDEEPSMLLALGGLLEQFELVVTYNGAAFDIPLLETRFTLSRLDSPFGVERKRDGAQPSKTISHFDLLFTARRLWRNGHGSCRLAALEREMISFVRGPDIPGAMIPQAYFDYLQHRPCAAFRSVFTHNVYDVISLVALTVQACDRVSLEPAALDEPLDLYSLGRVLESSADWRRSVRLYEMALAGGVLEPMRRKVLEDLAVIYRRGGEHERSLEICRELMQYPEFIMVGYEGAAIYHERVARDLDAALHVLHEGLSRAESKRSKMLLQARWDRLQQKIIQYD